MDLSSGSGRNTSSSAVVNQEKHGPISVWTLSGILVGFLGFQYRKEIGRWLQKHFFHVDETTILSTKSLTLLNGKEETQQNASAEFIRKHPKGLGDLHLLKGIQILETHLLPVPHLADLLGSETDCQILNQRTIDTMDDTAPINKYNRLMTSENVILGDIRRHPTMEPESRAYLRAGPRKLLYFSPKEVKAAIVTCGGLCPGLNNVIRDITLTLWNLYGVRIIYGIRGGFWGF